MIKKIALVLIVIILLGLLYGLGRQVYSSLNSGRRLESEVEDLTKLQKRNLELRNKLSAVGKLQFIEQQARDKLNLSREGETVVVIPESELQKVLGVKQAVQQRAEPYWQGWLKLFWK